MEEWRTREIAKECKEDKQHSDPFHTRASFRTKSKFLPQIHLFLDLQDSRFRRNIEIELQIEVLLARSARSPCQQKGISKFPKNEIEVSQITKNIRICK